MFAPRGSGKIASETIDLAPPVKTAAESLELLLAQARSRPRVMLDKFVSDKTTDAARVQKPQRYIDDITRWHLRQTLRVKAAKGSHWLCLQAGQRSNPGRDLMSEFFGAFNLSCNRHLLSHTPLPDSVGFLSIILIAHSVVLQSRRAPTQVVLLWQFFLAQPRPPGVQSTDFSRAVLCTFDASILQRSARLKSVL